VKLIRNILIAAVLSLASLVHDAAAASYVRMHCDKYPDTLVFQDLETGGTLRSSGSHNWAITGSWTFGPARPYGQPHEYIWSFGAPDGEGADQGQKALRILAPPGLHTRPGLLWPS
jgi:hypothetical protein